MLGRSLTVVIHNVDGVLVFGEAESPAAGQAQQRHQGTEHREPHGWGQVTALLNYLQTGTQPWAAAARDTHTTPCCTRGVLVGFQRWQQGHWWETAVWHSPAPSCSQTYRCLLISSWIYGHFQRSWRLSAHLIHRIRKRTYRLLTWQEKLSNLGLEF